ncbi:MAG: YihA family ribosome biogenesis GTP-binding protein [Clostridia bacterium]|nr:YihA family ribosome biogenesis GTP-binding protein [Clostridia bacterium]
MNFNNTYFEKAFGTFEQLTESDLPEFCFSGRSNVGKSSLINKLTGRKSLARVSGKPGKTVTVNFYRADNIRIVDLPGFGYAKVPFAERTRWSDLMEGYFKSGRNIKCVFSLIDMRHPATDFDISMLDFMQAMDIKYHIVLTKSDKLNKTEYAQRLALIETELEGYLDNSVEIIPFSAQTGQGCDKIKEIIEQLRG